MQLPALRNWSFSPYSSAFLVSAEVRIADPSHNLPAGRYSMVVAQRPEVVRWSVSALFFMD